MTALEVVMTIVIVLWIGAVIGFYLLGRNIKKAVEDVLKTSSEEEQTIIRNKVVKAVFPPRFNKN